MAQVIVENLYKSFPPQGKNQAKEGSPVNVLKAINLEIADGEFMVLVGPSGCGKSTLLRLIAGLETVTGGQIYIGDRRVNDLPPKARDIAMVFQSYALYPHLSVYDNIAFGLRRMPDRENNQTEDKLPRWVGDSLRGITKPLPKSLHYLSTQEKVLAQRVNQVAQQLQIDHLLDRLPKQLSGGQKQRVALGRAIARNPQVFLMDEPLSNLDAKLRAETRSQIVQIQRQLGITTIYVTHDQTEAMTMGDRIAVLNQGVIQQIAPPLTLYNQPANRFVGEFIGSPPMNFFTLKVASATVLQHLAFALNLTAKWHGLVAPYVGRSLILGVRPESFVLSAEGADAFPVKVNLVEALGNDTFIYAHLVTEPELTLQARIAPDHLLQVGEQLWLAINPEKIHLFDAKTEQAIDQR
ncbi:ABC transporter ATP-binding protein [Synechocystis sp. PCC 7339]|uniref:ABC transporter ATP-binding protein n=1 Tax=unclassified Synechocystis TaxID=2640012 RepID=UPI001BAE96A2|nr:MULTISPECIES: ABC transporter ATP-binding protein [unclassified Synechocystis]QUS62402.1 ABC transporter ATP-binding protein [Synechocystis sp. PCC 7338]UAJ74352.1 ABC transporter ATP-binding protein [Synechocystis sp. PCC 7339]